VQKAIDSASYVLKRVIWRDNDEPCSVRHATERSGLSRRVKGECSNKGRAADEVVGWRLSLRNVVSWAKKSLWTSVNKING